MAIRRTLLLLTVLGLYHFTFAQRIKSSLFQDWEDNDWMNTILVSRSYDGSGHLIRTDNDRWDSSSVNWEQNIRTTYINDGMGNTIERTTESWDTTSSSWAFTSKALTTYFANEKRQRHILQFYEQGNWVNFFKDTLIYDGNGHLTSMTRYRWDTLAGVWNLLLRQSYTNNTNGDYTENLEEAWLSVSSSWSNTQKIVRTLNPDNSVNTSTLYLWDQNNWVEESRQSYTYDSNGFLTHLLIEYWNQAGNSWENLSQNNYYNFNDGRLDTQIVQVWNAGAWMNRQKITINYEATTGLADISAEPMVKIYPNPASDRIYLELNSSDQILVEVYDQMGKLIDSHRVNGAVHSLNVDRLKNGTYFLVLDTRESRSVHPIVIAR